MQSQQSQRCCSSVHNANGIRPTSYKRSRRWAAVSFLLSTAIEQTTSFSPTAELLSSGFTTALNFRNNNLHDGFTTNAFVAEEGLLHDTRSTARSASNVDSMPVWLSTSKSHLAQENLRILQSTMRSTFFTENESRRLTKAIEEAAMGDLNKIAGAAEFCLMLLETMEMGLNALVAAAFHYCSCVTAREHAAANDEADTEDAWSTKSFVMEQHPSIESFGPHCVAIAADAARLKQLERVAGVVIQNSKSHVGPDRRDAENFRKLLLSETKDWRGLAIRSAACLFRLRGILSAPRKPGAGLTPVAVKTAREALHLYAPLASRLGMHRLKNELEGAAFRLLYRRQYECVQTCMEERRSHGDTIAESLSQVLRKVKADMTHMLEKDPEFNKLVDNYAVTARVKEPYSTWKKMLHNGYHHVLQVPDLLALRIVLKAKKLSPDEPAEVTRARERALCYYAQRLCTERWTPDHPEPRFKDYIERPKANGYQSLHYTALSKWAGENWNLEIQIRSSEMHQVAEFGLASHWDYKAQTKESKKPAFAKVRVRPDTQDEDQDHSSDSYLRDVQQWHWQQRGSAVVQQWDASPATFEPVVMSSVIWQSRERSDRIRERTQRLQPYLKALTDAQLELARQFVFVFFTQVEGPLAQHGKVLALPAGACVWDALRQARQSMGLELKLSTAELGLALNGATTSVTRKLQNGDILTLPHTALSPVAA